MPRRLATGRPGTHTIPHVWAQRHARLAERQMIDVCSIGRAGDPVYNEETHEVESTFVELWSGRCKAQARTGQAAPTETADQEKPVRDYIVSVPRDALPGELAAGLIVTITDTTDPDLLDRRLVVEDVIRGTLVWQRDLLCVSP